jgi:hypothetical protein
MGLIFINNFSVTGDCSQTNSGVVSFSVSGTSPGFTVSELTSTGSFPTSALTAPLYAYEVSGLSGDSYFLQVLDGDGNTRTVPVYISTGTMVGIDKSDTTCGSNNGNITGNTTYVYGTATYYLYNISDQLINSGLTSNLDFTFSNLSADTYYLVADDGGGCTGQSASVVVLSSSTFDYGYYVVDDASCGGSGSGKIFLTGLTPSSAYTINWSTLPSQSGNTTVTGLTGGTYIVNVTNSEGCSVTKSIVVPTISPMGLGSWVTTSPTCFSSNGVAELIITGGTAPYFYSGSNGDTVVSFSQTYSFSGLGPGQLFVNVTDAGLCTLQTSVTLLSPNSFSTVSVTTTNATCSQDDGSMQIVVDNGLSTLPNLTFIVSGSPGYYQTVTYGSPIQDFMSLASGDYIYIVSGGTGCSYTGTTTINNTPLFDFTATTVDTTCGLNNGSISVVVSTGGTFPYQFTLVGPSYSPITTSNFLGTFNNLAYGNYLLTVNDSNTPQCNITQNVYVGISQGPFFSFYTYQPTLGNDGSIQALITSGTAPFTLNWSSNVNGQTGLTVTSLTAGTYSLTVIDNNGCSYSASTTLVGTSLQTSYRLSTVCSQTFGPSGTTTRRGVRQMYLEGFLDLTSGDTGCVVTSADFTVQAIVGSQSAETIFYSSSGITDYPSDQQYVDAVEQILESFIGIDDVTIILNDNKITITNDCTEIQKNCGAQFINLLQDTPITINLLIGYDISCISCSP